MRQQAGLAQWRLRLICNEELPGVRVPYPAPFFLTGRRNEMIEVIASEKAPKALGPYSQALKIGGFVFCSGQIPLVPETGAIVEGGIDAQTRQAISNLANVLAAANSSLSDVVKTTVFIKDMNDFAALNAVYAEMFGDTKPARSCVEVARLPKDVKVEIECIAVANG